MESLRGYKKSISEATGVTDAAMLAEIEDVMRNDIFNSTLDWQSRAVFDKAARMACAWLRGETKELKGETKELRGETKTLNMQFLK